MTTTRGRDGGVADARRAVDAFESSVRALCGGYVDDEHDDDDDDDDEAEEEEEDCLALSMAFGGDEARAATVPTPPTLVRRRDARRGTTTTTTTTTTGDVMPSIPMPIPKPTPETTTHQSRRLCHRVRANTNTMTRIVVKTTAEKLDDGYKWRKYGNKWVRGGSHPRAYYKCTSDGGVGVLQKHVERFDARRFLVTYYGRSPDASGALLKRLYEYLHARASHRASCIDSVEMISR
jgi:hypothetical protein